MSAFSTIARRRGAPREHSKRPCPRILANDGVLLGAGGPTHDQLHRQAALEPHRSARRRRGGLRRDDAGRAAAPALLDLLITLNISAALTIVVATMYLGKALDFASFPSLLLLTTMFRLAINVSVTRLILTTGDAGSVVKAFGSFVVGGNVVVGLVIFLILVVIQFVVVTNGAGRVAEVGARFTLDAMPGKQMAIDADLNAGLITDDQARAAALGDRARGRLLRRDGRRFEVRQGRRDGGARSSPRSTSSAGSSWACCRRNLGFSEATHQYSLLTVGDGLAAQIPALLISVADRHHRHARRLRPRPGQRHRQPDPQPAPGADGGGRRDRPVRADPGPAEAAVSVHRRDLRAVGWAVRNGMPEAQRGRRGAAKAKAAELAAPAAVPEPLSEVGVDALELAIGFGLVPLGQRRRSLLRRVSMIRRQIAGDLGLVIPPVRIHDELGMESHEYVLKVRGSEVTRGRIMPGHLLAMDPGDASATLQGIPTREPAFGLDAMWVHDSGRAEAEALGYTVVDAESVIVTHLTETIRAHAAELLTRQDVRALLDKLKETNAAVVEEVVPDTLSLGEIQRVLQLLLSEGVPIRDLGTIVEAIGDKARITRDTNLLSEYARQALGRAITAPHLDEELRLRAITLDPAIEQEVATSITQTADGEYLAMDPPRAQAIVGALRAQVEHASGRGVTTGVVVLSARAPPPA